MKRNDTIITPITSGPTIAVDHSESSEMPLWLFITLSCSHVLLALMMREKSEVATAHALLTGIGAIVVALRGKLLQHKYAFLGYIVGSEVLWRMNAASVPWMYSSYLAIIVAVIGLTRHRGVERAKMLPLMYALLLLPSIFIMMEMIGDTNTIRRIIAFNFLPPLTLGVVLTLSSRLHVHDESIRTILLYSVMPLIGVATLAAHGVFFEPIAYLDVSESNYQAAGGYGPNQVSNVLSIGSLALFVAARHYEKNVVSRIMLYTLAAWFLVQVGFTLSRGGIYNAAGFAVVYTMMNVWGGGSSRKALLGVIVATVVAVTYVVPMMDEYTGGALNRRYTDESVGARDILIQTDMRMFNENVLAGVGIGMSPFVRGLYGHSYAAHTEWSRMLAEHGLLGAASLLCLLMYLVGLVYRARGWNRKGVVLGLIAVVMISFSHQAMRTSDVTFLVMMMQLIAASEMSHVIYSKTRVTSVT